MCNQSRILYQLFGSRVAHTDNESVGADLSNAPKTFVGYTIRRYT